MRKIVAANDSFIDIEESSNRFVLEIAANIPEVKWYVRYSGYPSPTIKWRDSMNNEIPWTYSKNKYNKIDARLEKSLTILKIRNPTINDSGTYTLYANNERMERKQEFVLFVRGKRDTK